MLSFLFLLVPLCAAHGDDHHELPALIDQTLPDQAITQPLASELQLSGLADFDSAVQDQFDDTYDTTFNDYDYSPGSDYYSPDYDYQTEPSYHNYELFQFDNAGLGKDKNTFGQYNRHHGPPPLPPPPPPPLPKLLIGHKAHGQERFKGNNQGKTRGYNQGFGQNAFKGNRFGRKW